MMASSETDATDADFSGLVVTSVQPMTSSASSVVVTDTLDGCVSQDLPTSKKGKYKSNHVYHVPETSATWMNSFTEKA